MITKIDSMKAVLENAGYVSDYLEKNIDCSIKAKSSLKEFMSKSQYWNEEELAICIPVTVPTLSTEINKITKSFKLFLVDQFSQVVQQVTTPLFNEAIFSYWKALNNSPLEEERASGKEMSRYTVKITIKNVPSYASVIPFLSDYYQLHVGYSIWNAETVSVEYDELIEEVEKSCPNISNIFLAYNILNELSNNVITFDDLQALNLKRILVKHKSKISSRLKVSRIINRLLKDVPFPIGAEKELNCFLTKLGDACKAKELKRELKFSIHPYDFLTMSNTILSEGWHSCHTLDAGNTNRCYQAGVFSYMLDEVSIVAYIHSIGSSYKENRTMVFISKDHQLGCHGRIYPQEGNHETIAKIYDKWLESELFSGLEKTICNKSTKLPFLKTQEGSCHYPDYDYYYYSSAWGDISKQNILVGSPYFYCLECGDKIENNKRYVSESCLCFDCREDDYFHCACCGEIIRREHGSYIVNKWYCEDCYSDIEW